MIDWANLTPWTSLIGGVAIGLAAAMLVLLCRHNLRSRQGDQRLCRLQRGQPGAYRHRTGLRRPRESLPPYLDATYQSVESVNGTGNSTNDVAAGGAPGVEGGTIRIQPGNRIPLIPRHLFKAYADYPVSAELALGLNLVVVGSSYARGNENNAHQPDGITYLGAGRSGGYGVLNLNADYRVDPRLKFFGQINNLLDRRYYTAALLGATGFTGSGNFIARPLPAIAGDFPVRQSTFYAPGAPRTYWIGVRYQFDASARKN